jgi:hypothetical protein
MYESLMNNVPKGPRQLAGATGGVTLKLYYGMMPV